MSVLGALAGLIVGAGLGALAFGGEDDPAPPEGAAADVAAGCSLIARVPDYVDTGDGSDGWSFEGSYLHRVGAAGEAFQAAGNADAGYRDLAEAGARLTEAYRRFDFDEFNRTLDELRERWNERDE